MTTLGYAYSHISTCNENASSRISSVVVGRCSLVGGRCFGGRNLRELG
jgi:hypothetical protein